MTIQAHPALRAVILPGPDAHPQETPTRRLLDELGHDVTRAASADHAMELLNADPTDLLIVDVTNSDENRELISRIAEMPAAQWPRQVAIFSDHMDAQLSGLRKAISPSHVHVFLKPLHVHGLLTILRQMEQQASRTTPAGAGA